MLHKQIQSEIKEALLAKEKVRLLVVRGLVAAFTNELVAKKRKPEGELTDDEAMTVIKRSVKQHKDSIDQFLKGGRKDLVKSEEAELKILETYLPKAVGIAEIKKIAAEQKKKLGVTDKSGAGKLIGAILKELKGQADGTEVKNIVDEMLG